MVVMAADEAILQLAMQPSPILSLLQSTRSACLQRLLVAQFTVFTETFVTTCHDLDQLFVLFQQWQLACLRLLASALVEIGFNTTAFNRGNIERCLVALCHDGIFLLILLRHLLFKGLFVTSHSRPYESSRLLNTLQSGCSRKKLIRSDVEYFMIKAARSTLTITPAFQPSSPSRMTTPRDVFLTGVCKTIP